MVDYKYLNVPDLCGYKAKYYYSNKVSEENPRNWTPHLHDSLEIYVLVEGDVSFAVETSYYKLSPGDAIIAKPNEIHNCILNTRSVHRHLCFWFDPGSEFIFDDFLRHGIGESNHIVPDKNAKEELISVYDQLICANAENDKLTEFYLTLRILGTLRKFINVKKEEECLPPLMREILSDINKNIKSIKNLDYLTAKYYVSHSTLYRMFKDYMNTTPKNYIETKKLASSRKLLKEGRCVGDAASESGFSDVSNFIRLFKKRFGVTPKEYKGN